jgi:hypothetical protein
MLAFVFMFETLRDFSCLLLFYHMKVVLLGAYRPQTPFAKILIYLAQNWLHLIIYSSNFYGDSSILLVSFAHDYSLLVVIVIFINFCYVSSTLYP